MTTCELSALRRLFVTQEPFIDSELDAIAMLDLIYSLSVENILDIIKSNQNELRSISAANIPQFSNPDVIFKVLKVVIDSESNDLNFERIGYYLRPRGTKPGALRKYGENHYKFAMDLGLVTEKRPFSATDLGLAFYLMEDTDKRLAIQKKLVLRVPIIQQALLTAETDMIDMAVLMRQYLKESTVKRRSSNVRKLLHYIMDNADVDLQHTLNNIIWR